MLRRPTVASAVAVLCALRAGIAAPPTATQPASRGSPREQRAADMGYRPAESALRITHAAGVRSLDGTRRYTIAEFEFVQRWLPAERRPGQAASLPHLELPRFANRGDDPLEHSPCRVLTPVVRGRYPLRLAPTPRSDPHPRAGYVDEWIAADEDFARHRSAFPAAVREADEWRSESRICAVFDGDIRLSDAPVELHEFIYDGDMEYTVDLLRKQHADADTVIARTATSSTAVDRPTSPTLRSLRAVEARSGKPRYQLVLADAAWLPRPTHVRLDQVQSDAIADADARIVAGAWELTFVLPRPPAREQPTCLVWSDLNLVLPVGN